MSEAIRNRRLRAIKDENMQLVEYPPLGRDWVHNFLKRHPQFKTVVGRTIDSARIQGTSPEVLKKWFDAFEEEVVNDPDLLLANQFQAQPGRQEWVTVVECISAICYLQGEGFEP